MKAVLFSSEKLEIRKSIIHGWGVFTRDQIDANELLAECHGILINPREMKRCNRVEGIARASIRVGEYLYIIPNGVGGYFNSHHNNNVTYYYDKKEKIISFYSTSLIKKDRELLLNYEEARLELDKKDFI